MQTKFNCCFLAQDSATLIGNSYPVLQLGSDSITASSHVCQLGVDIFSNLSFDQHVSRALALYQRYQLRRIRLSLDLASIATLVPTLVTTRIDYCSIILANTPKFVTDKLQWVLNAALHVVSRTKKLVRTAAWWTPLAWCAWTEFFSGLLWRCISVWMAAVLIWMISAFRSLPLPHDICAHLVVINWWCLATGSTIYGRQVLLVVRLAVWNSLPDTIWDPNISANAFSCSLKTFCSRDISAYRAMWDGMSRNKPLVLIQLTIWIQKYFKQNIYYCRILFLQAFCGISCSDRSLHCLSASN